MIRRPLAGFGAQSPCTSTVGARPAPREGREMRVDGHPNLDAVASEDMMMQRYRQAIERAMTKLPVKNGVIDIDSIWVETSIPYTVLRSLLQAGDLKLPDNVERVNLKSHVDSGQRRGNRKHRKQ